MNGSKPPQPTTAEQWRRICALNQQIGYLLGSIRTIRHMNRDPELAAIIQRTVDGFRSMERATVKPRSTLTYSEWNERQKQLRQRGHDDTQKN